MIDFNQKHKAVPIAWDPSSPASLLMASDSNNLNITLASDGLGCTPEEISALLQLLKARDQFEDQFDEFVYHMDDREKSLQLFELSTQYVQIIHQCITHWSDRIASSDTELDTETQNLNFLMQMHSILHLSSIYQLSPYFSISDTVRFLRHHFVPNPLDDVSLFEDANNEMKGNEEEIDSVEQMLSSSQPEYYQGGTPYWTLVEHLIKCGMLKDAWAILSNHSACRNCAREVSDPEQQEELEKIRRGFSHLYALLHSAPIPAGHTPDHDMENNHDENNKNIKDDLSDAVLLDGVPAKAYQFWEHEETCPAAYSHWMTWNTAVHSAFHDGLDGGLHRRIPQLVSSVLSILVGQPPTQQPNSSLSSWASILLQEILYARPNLNASEVCVRASAAMRAVWKLTGNDERNFKRTGLENIALSIMRGDAGSAIEATHILGGGSGAALPSTLSALLCDLFTHADLLHPFDSDPSESTSKAIINHHVEFLLSAATACQSSFATTPTNSLVLKNQHKQIGVQCAVRLLRYSHHIRGIATTAQITSSLDQNLATDQDTTALLKLCDYRFIGLGDDHHPVKKNKKRQEILLLQDAYIDICLSRANYHLRHSRPGGAAHWCLKCIQFELKGFTKTAIGSQRGKQLLEIISRRAAIDLLNAVCLVFECCTIDDICEDEKVSEILEQNNIVNHCLTYANEIWSALHKDETEQDLNATVLLQHLTDDELTSASLTMLKNTIQLTKGFIQRNNRDVANAVTGCLEESRTGVSAASIGMWSKFLNLAFVILLRQEEQSFEHGDIYFSCVFDIKGVQVLMASLALLSASRADSEEKEHSFFTLDKMRVLLGKALMHAFVAENKKRKKSSDKKVQPKSNPSLSDCAKGSNIIESVQRSLNIPTCMM